MEIIHDSFAFYAFLIPFIFRFFHNSTRHFTRNSHMPNHFHFPAGSAGNRTDAVVQTVLSINLPYAQNNRNQNKKQKTQTTPQTLFSGWQDTRTHERRPITLRIRSVSPAPEEGKDRMHVVGNRIRLHLCNAQQRMQLRMWPLCGAVKSRETCSMMMMMMIMMENWLRQGVGVC